MSSLFIKTIHYFTINNDMSTVYLQPRNPVGNLKKLDFPYTPQIEYGQEVKYDSYGMSHTNYQTYGYGRTENPSINMTCKFSAHTSEHFNLSAYAIRFLRTYTKMNYGRTDPSRGLPPRILRFFAYGNQAFDNVPVVISKFNMTFPEDIDYVQGTVDVGGDLYKNIVTVRKPETPTNNPTLPSGRKLDMGDGEGYDLQNVTMSGMDTAGDDTPSSIAVAQTANGNGPTAMYLPVFFTISIGLLIQQNLYTTVNNFNLEDFAAGKLNSKGYI
jgi:hypothetical protein